MIWVDYRRGSIELLPALQKAGVPADKATLDAGDFAFTGNGPEGPVEVGIERKVLRDLIDSLNTGRLQGMQTESGKGGQLGRLIESYDFPWLLVEGVWVTNKQGRLCTRKSPASPPKPILGGMTADSMTKRILSLELKGGLRLKETAGPKQTVAWLVSTFRWFTDKGWDQHETLNVTPRGQGLHAGRLSRLREMLLSLPGVGLAASRAIESLLAELGGDKLVTLAGLPVFKLAEMKVQTPAGPKAFGWSKAEKVIEAIRNL